MDCLNKIIVVRELRVRRAQDTLNGSGDVWLGGRSACSTCCRVLDGCAVALEMQDPGRNDGRASDGHPANGPFSTQRWENANRHLAGPVGGNLTQLVPDSGIAEPLDQSRRVRLGSLSPENEVSPSFCPEGSTQLLHSAPAIASSIVVCPRMLPA
jgi:hypothetical protein